MNAIDLTGLSAQLACAAAPDRLLDGQLWDLIDPRPRFAIPGEPSIYKQDPGDDVQFDCAPEYTADLNLACALLQQIFPGREADLLLKPDLSASEVILWHPDDLVPDTMAELIAEPSKRTARATGQAPIALCHAIVKALIAEKETAALAA